MGSKASNSNISKDISKKSKKNQEKQKKFSTQVDPDVVVNLPGGLKYKLPGKRQRVLIGSIVVGLNVLLVISVILYFYSPAFQDFIYNVGR
tara:strand:+ start:76 stop:348 length:273 start_codon:yes stop_codon:yes gene_type:complete